MTIVRRLTAADAPSCDDIIAALPYFFADPAGIANAARDVRSGIAWVTQDDGRVTGFLSLAWSTPEAAEIAWMAVHPDFRRAGKGRLLMKQAVDFAWGHGAKMLFLFASPAEDPLEVLDGFGSTRSFYLAQGFVPLWIVKPEGWSAEHLLMVRSLE